MECFNTLLLKLREAHEREVGGWQVKIQELSNKKGCDTRRMEELLTKNQQMKEQQRLLTENIKTLENRLRAGLCDRCTVTQEVAKRQQQEFEASQVLSLQHISLLAGEMNNLKKENKRLKDEIKILRVAIHEQSSNSCTTKDLKSNSSPDLSPPPGPATLLTGASSKADKQAAGGDVAGKTEAQQRAEENEQRRWRSSNRKYFDSYKPLLMASARKSDHTVSCAGGSRAPSVEGLDQLSSISPQALLLKNSSLTSGEVNPSRHVLHAPVPCRPQPIKSSPISLPWSSHPAASLMLQTSATHIPNLIQAGQHDSPQTQGFGSIWQKQSNAKPSTTEPEPTVLFRLRSLTEQVEGQSETLEKKEKTPSRAEWDPAEGLRGAYEGPLDLSDRGKSTSSQSPTDYLPSDLKDIDRAESSPDKGLKTNPVSSPHHGIPPPSSPSVKQPEEEPPTNQKTKQVVKDQELKKEANMKLEQGSKKKVPLLTISLRPVVVLETLNSALQKQESLSMSDKSAAAAGQMENSPEERDREQCVVGQEGSQGCKRKRSSVEMEADLNVNNIQQDRKLKITMTTEEKVPS